MIFKEIKGFPNYKISLSGQVKNSKGETINPYLCNGYLRVHLYREGKYKRFLVHRLVASAFLKKTKNKTDVNHKDGNKQNNKVTNLEWVTKSENQKHSYKTGLHSREKFKKLSFWDVYYIRSFKEERKFSNAKIAEVFNVSETTIQKIVNNKTHKDYLRRVWNEQ